MLPQRNQDKSACTPLVVTYHPTLPSLHSTTKWHHSILHASEQLWGAFPLPPLSAFHHPRNLRDHLVRATLTSTPHELPGNRPCRDSQCKTCPILVATNEFSSHKTGTDFKLKIKASCKLSNVIYLTTCRRFGHQYVGEIGQPLHRRINSHPFDTTHGRTDESPVAEHFNSDSHSIADMTVMVINQIRSCDPCLQKIDFFWRSHAKVI